MKKTEILGESQKMQLIPEESRSMKNLGKVNYLSIII